MTRNESRVRGTVENGFVSMVVRIDRDGQESVIGTYKVKIHATRAAAEKSAAKYIAKAGM